mmetsp:Transcript_15433/g.22944  ORF Transcript_15433/g.22944 Transcript_15433/m.22944 type:complete len:405 (-) Transcript_15433:63-1277(-)
MVKLDVSCIRHMSKDDFRVLTAVEMGMKNHDLVPVELITSIAQLRSGGINRIITTLHIYKLIAHDRSTYDGYRLTFAGYDVLALHVLFLRGHISAVGNKIGCGKESDIYIAQNSEGSSVVLKMHRLGRTCFRAVRQKRDYLKGRSKPNWLYLSRLSALKEFAFMKALYDKGYPTPTPIDHNRHIVCMSIVPGCPMYQLRSGSIDDPEEVFLECIDLIKRLANHGLIHCDFNEFNIMIHENPENSRNEVTLIDFPQMISVRHRNAKEMFERDVNCVVKFFTMKMKWEPPEELIPRFFVGSDTNRIDDDVRASGFTEEGYELGEEFLEQGMNDLEIGEVEGSDPESESEDKEGTILNDEDARKSIEKRAVRSAFEKNKIHSRKTGGSRNSQKKKFKGKVLRKGKDF